MKALSLPQSISTRFEALQNPCKAIRRVSLFENAMTGLSAR
jgi:hypothetical protein